MALNKGIKERVVTYMPARMAPIKTEFVGKQMRCVTNAVYVLHRQQEKKL